MQRDIYSVFKQEATGDNGEPGETKSHLVANAQLRLASIRDGRSVLQAFPCFLLQRVFGRMVSESAVQYPHTAPHWILSARAPRSSRRGQLMSEVAATLKIWLEGKEIRQPIPPHPLFVCPATMS